MLMNQLTRSSWCLYKYRLFIASSQQLTSFQKFLGLPNSGSLNIRSCSATSDPVVYIQKENNFLFQVVNEIPLSSSNVLNTNEMIVNEAAFLDHLSQNWRHSNATEIVKAFYAVKQFCIDHNITISDSRFDNLVDGLMDHCEKLTNQELLDLLQCLLEYPQCLLSTAHNHHDVWNCLDDICCWKLSSMDIETAFAIGDLWYKLRLAKLGNYVFEVLDRYTKKADKLTKSQLLHVFFLFNVCRRRPIDFEYEHALQHKIDEFNVDEMAVVALGYFKTKSKIKLQYVIDSMIQQVTNSVMGIHEITLSAIMKVIRFSTPTKSIDQIRKMLKALEPELDRFSELAHLHVALLPTSLQIYQPNILKKCSQSLINNLSNIRLKDIERTLHVLTLFTFDPPAKSAIFETLFDEIHKQSRLSECALFPRSLIASLYYFSLKEIYSYELMNRILDFEFISTHFSKSARNLPGQLFFLNSCIDIDCCDYKGNRLPIPFKYKAAKYSVDWPPSYDQYKKLSIKDKLFLDTKNVIEEIVENADFLMINHVLPHFATADIIICKDTNTGLFVKPKGFEQYVLGEIMRPPQSDNLKYYSVVLLTWNNIIRDTDLPMGFMVTKTRQLQKIGFSPVTVIFNQFTPLSQKEKKQYILNKLN